MHISSSYAKILGEKLFRTWEIPRSGSKAKDGGKERERDWTMVITMAKLRMAHASMHVARKPPGPKSWFSPVFSSFHGQRSVTAAWATRSPWSILFCFSSKKFIFIAKIYQYYSYVSNLKFFCASLFKVHTDKFKLIFTSLNSSVKGLDRTCWVVQLCKHESCWKFANIVLK